MVPLGWPQGFSRQPQRLVTVNHFTINTRVKKGTNYELNLNLIEVTISWNDVEITLKNLTNRQMEVMFSNHLIKMM
jgi:hypothetical protein